MKYFYSYWLSPGDQDALYLENIIQNLAFEYKSQTFLPHVTLYGTVLLEQKQAKQILHEAAMGVVPFEIEIDKIDHSNEFFKSLFIRLKMNDGLEKLHNNFKKHLEDHISYTFEPHISLLYQNLDIEQKQSIIKKLNLKNTYKVSYLACVNLGVKEEDFYQINQWKMEGSVALQ